VRVSQCKFWWLDFFQLVTVLLIGRGGQRIRELEETSGARIKVKYDWNKFQIFVCISKLVSVSRSSVASLLVKQFQRYDVVIVTKVTASKIGIYNEWLWVCNNHIRQLEVLNWALIPCSKLKLCCVEYLPRISKCGAMFMLQSFVYLIYGYSFIMSVILSVEYRLRPWLLSRLWLWASLEEFCGQTGFQNAYQKGIDGTFSLRKTIARPSFQAGSTCRHHMPRSVHWSGRSGPTDGLKGAVLSPHLLFLSPCPFHVFLQQTGEGSKNIWQVRLEFAIIID